MSLIMKEYLIIYGYDRDPYRVKATSPLNAVLSLFEYSGGSSLFSSDELNKLGEEFGTQKLIHLYNHEHVTIHSVGVFEPLYEDETDN